MMQAVLDEFQPGRTIYLPGASGEALALADALQKEPDRARGVHLVSCLVPGMNRFDYAALSDSVTLTAFMLPPACQNSFAAGRVKLLPLAYTAIANYLQRRLRLDVAVAHVAPPDNDGNCSLGIASDFVPLLWVRAGRRVAIVNASMPSMPRGPRIALAEADIVMDGDGPLICAPSLKSTDEFTAVAKHVASLLDDGAALQIGIGGAPASAWQALHGHRNLTLASGMVAEGMLGLAEAGALAPGATHVAGVAYGSAAFYAFLAQSDLVEFASVPRTHGLARLATLTKFTAINSAIEVDLTGQINTEWRDGRLCSGIGGATDFMRGAEASPGGRSIIALTAADKGGAVSRIVAKLSAPTVSISRADADTIVTEYGVAELRDRDINSRAAALIAIAAPAHREKLARAWHDLRKEF